MNKDFDIFVKQHLEDVLCWVEKEHALAQLENERKKMYRHAAHPVHQRSLVPIVQLQDCAVSPTFTYSNL